MQPKQRRVVLVICLVCALVLTISLHWVAIPLAAAGAGVLVALVTHLARGLVLTTSVACITTWAALEIRGRFYPVSTHIAAAAQSEALVLLFMIAALAAIGKRRGSSAENRVA